MDFLKQAEAILGSVEDQSDWVEEKISSDPPTPRQTWAYRKHPPGSVRRGEMVDCLTCGCIVLKLDEPYHNCDFWCLHCGPQAEARRYN